ncbi:hypothetical protein KUCAC02_028385, partial [Chaenocephalus aceratus]
VSATAEDGNLFARLFVETDTFGSRSQSSQDMTCCKQDPRTPESIATSDADDGKVLPSCTACVSGHKSTLHFLHGNGKDGFTQLADSHRVNDQEAENRVCCMSEREARQSVQERGRNQREVHFIKRLHTGPAPLPKHRPKQHFEFIRFPASRRAKRNRKSPPISS